jgi:hypothetical protein
VLCADGESLVLGVVLGLCLEVFVKCHCTSRAHHTCGDAAGLVAEDEACDDIEEANNNGEDTGGDEQTPER